MRRPFSCKEYPPTLLFEQNTAEVISTRWRRNTKSLQYKRGDLSLEEQNGTVVLHIRNSQAGVIVSFSARDSEIYSLRFKYRARESFSVQLWDVDERFDELQNVTLYNDRVPPSPGGLVGISYGYFRSLFARNWRRAIHMHSEIGPRLASEGF